MNPTPEPTVLISADAELAQLVAAAAATRGSAVRTIRQVGDIRSNWRDAAAVLVGADLAETAARLSLPPRDEVYLIGPGDADEALMAWSAPLKAAVIRLPAGSRWLAQVLAGTGRAAHGQIIALAGGSGGIGASTLAAGLALAARRRGPSALVDLDARGGGLDLVLGAESAPGWRWDTLRSASGQVADFASQLPAVDGVMVVSASRSDRRDPPGEAVGAVIDGLARAGGTVVVDLGRSGGAHRDEAVRAASRLVVLAGQSVRSVAATAALLTELSDRRTDLVVRTDRGGAIAAPAVAEALGMTLLGAVPTVPALVTLADRGLPPGPGAGRRWERACRRLAERLAGAETRGSRRRGARP
ncbi:MAG: pilus assembly protein CpaE [Propionibacteriaceae bacterium]|nr:pilus assembly protein CpaE [Propionibacteriaceae bacterium]